MEIDPIEKHPAIAAPRGFRQELAAMARLAVPVVVFDVVLQLAAPAAVSSMRWHSDCAWWRSSSRGSSMASGSITRS